MTTLQTLDIARLQMLFTEKDIRNMEDIMFYVEDDGSYNVFDVYRIRGKNRKYTVEKHGMPVEHVFSELRYALTWCINSRRNKLYSIKEIVELDKKLISVSIDIQIQRSLLNKGIDRDLHEIKLSECTLRRSTILRKLQEFVDESNQWQTKKFGTRVNLNEK